MLSEIIKRISQKSPVTVMAHAILNNVLSDEKLNQIFKNHRQSQRESRWLFSMVVGLMTLVVFQVRRSVGDAYKHYQAVAPAQKSPLYEKINKTEPQVSEALVRETAAGMKAILQEMNAGAAPLIKGYESKIVDGNKIAATQRRLEPLRNQPIAPLAGFALVVYEPEYRLISEAILCEDAYAQERSLFPRLLELAKPNQLWFADRNFCCSNYLMGLVKRGSFFVIRHHANIPFTATSELVFSGGSTTGDVFEQKGIVTNPETGESIEVRRIEVRLKSKTRDGDTTLSILSNLPDDVLGTEIANSYHGRWKIETAFQEMEKILDGESQTLCYPPAALLSLCVSYVSYNLLQCLTKTIEVTHPNETRKVSSYYVAGDVVATYEGMLLVTEREDWQDFSQWNPKTMAEFLLDLGRRVNYKRYEQNPPPKRKENRKQVPRGNHASTMRLLKNYQKNDETLT
jgi:hypothetical protein